MDRRGIFHPNTDLRAYAHGELGDPHIIRAAKGIHIHDQHGNEFIDAFAGLWCVNVGYGRTEIADAMHEQVKRLHYYHAHWAFSNEPVIRLTERVLKMAPAGMSKIFWGLQGSDAHETQVKIAWYYNNVLDRPTKKKIIARDRAYHGLTIMSGSLTGRLVLHQTFDLPLDRVRHTMAPYYYRCDDPRMSEREFSTLCAERLDALIETDGDGLRSEKAPRSHAVVVTQKRLQAIMRLVSDQRSTRTCVIPVKSCWKITTSIRQLHLDRTFGRVIACPDC